MSHADNSDSLCFLSFRLDLRGGRLLRGDEAIPLRPKTWGVLVYLVQRPGRLVTKDELLDALWAEVAVTPDTVAKSIGELRVALGDNAKQPRCIETVHRRGFRFIAEVGSGAEIAEPARSTASMSASGARPFVGREAELEKLTRHLARARAGDRQIVFVTGAAGIGKSALVDAFLDTPAVHSGSQPVWVGRGGCLEQYGPREAYMPVLEALERLAHRPDGERLVKLLRRVAPTWLAQIAWLSSDDAETAGTAVAAGRTERMVRELAVLCEALTIDVPLVLVLEDLHWSDPSTIDLLGYLAHRSESARLLVLGTYRPAEIAVEEHVLAQTMRTLRSHRRSIEIPVHDLTSVDVERYLKQRFPGSAFPPALAQLIHVHTDGNPLFMVSVVDHLQARGWILETAPGWALSTTPERIDLGVPDDVRRMIEVQLEILAPADRDLLEAASVSGVEFAPQAIAAPLGIEPAEAESRCEVLARANRFLRPAGRSEWPDGTVARRYGFSHELYRHVVYGEIPEGRRQALHQRIGEGLEAAYGGALEIAPELVVHFERSHDHTRLLRYLSIAAARARHRFANREAYDYLAPAIVLAGRLPSSTNQARQELELRMSLAPILSDLHGFASEPVRENAERAYALCTDVGSEAQAFQILYALSQFHAVRVDPVRVPECNAKLDALAGRLQRPEYRLLADSIVERCAFYAGDFAGALRMAEERRATADRQAIPQPFAYGADAVIASDCHFAHSLWALGYVERADAAMRAAVAAADGSSPFTRTAVLGHSCVLALFEGQHLEVSTLADQVLALSAQQGFPFWNAMAAAMRGWAWIRRGEVSEGIAEVEAARAALHATGARLFSTHVLAFLAEGQFAAGNVAAAVEAIDAGLAIAETTLDRIFWSELWRLKGEILASSADERKLRDADRCLQQALDLARKSESKSFELRAATSRARVWLARGQSADARRILNRICAWFDTCPITADLAAARALLVTIPSPPSRGAAAARAAADDDA